jgi:hypothetical protein
LGLFTKWRHVWNLLKPIITWKIPAFPSRFEDFKGTRQASVLYFMFSFCLELTCCTVSVFWRLF